MLELEYNLHQQVALRAIRFADVRFGILPTQSGVARNDEYRSPASARHCPVPIRSMTLSSMAANPSPSPVHARHRNVNRAEVCDQNFVEFVQNWRGESRRAPRADEAVLPGSLCTARDFAELFESQLI